VFAGPSFLGKILALVSCGLLLGCSQALNTGTLSFAPSPAVVQPTSSDTIPVKATLAVASLTGPSDAGSKVIVHQIDAAAVKYQMALIADPATTVNYSLRGYILTSRAGSELVISHVWDVFDQQGIRIGRNAGSERVPGLVLAKDADVWTSIGQPVTQRIAESAIAAITNAKPFVVEKTASVTPAQ